MGKIKYSIIIPVYNSEKYLSDCFLGLSSNSLNECEIIFVDDCSKDESMELISNFQTNHTNVIILQNEKNMGPSYSRNRGIDIAKGDYIIFVDSDDIISNNFINIINKYNCYDIIILKDTTNKDELGAIGKHEVFSPSIALSFYSFPPVGVGVQLDGPWAKVFRKDIINDNKLRFNESLRIGEDVVFLLEYILLCNQNIVIDYSITYYFRRDEYLKTGKPYKNIDAKIVDFIKAYDNVLKKYQLPDVFYKRLCYNIMDGYIFQIFERYFFNLSFRFNLKTQRKLLSSLFKNHSFKKAVKTTNISSINNHKKRILILFIKLKMYYAASILLRKKYFNKSSS